MKSVSYVGMDVHKETIDCAVMEEFSGEIGLEKRMGNSMVSVKRFFARLLAEGPVVAGYEAGCLGYKLQRELTGLGVKCVVIAPSRIARAPAERVKTDRRDARMLAKLLRNGEAQAVHVPEPADEAVRDYLRARADLRVELKRYRQRLGNLLIRHGYVYSEGKKSWTLRYRRWLKELEFAHEALAETVELYYGRILELEAKLLEMDGRIEEIAESERYGEAVGRLRSLRGIDYLIALAMVCEIGDFRRFASAEQFMAFLGLVPTEHTSGSKRQQGGITKTGNRHIRRLLVESSWHYRYHRPPSKALRRRREGQSEEVVVYADRAMRRLAKKFHRLVGRGKSSQLAVTAVARELAGFVWGLMVDRLELPRQAA
jgi:transposase